MQSLGLIGADGLFKSMNLVYSCILTLGARESRKGIYTSRNMREEGENFEKYCEIF